MSATARRDNLLGAFVLAVADQIRDETEQAVGHTGAAAAALVTIAHFPGRTVEFLRQAVGLSHPAAVRVVDGFTNQGLVRRRPSGHGPAVALTVTAAGRRQARAVLDVRAAVVARALPRLSATESATLTAVLERALTRLSDTPGSTICRLCDQGQCRHRDCPVELRQVELGMAPAEPSPLR